jgi:hypothetical protein
MAFVFTRPQVAYYRTRAPGDPYQSGDAAQHSRRDTFQAEQGKVSIQTDSPRFLETDR